MRGLFVITANAVLIVSAVAAVVLAPAEDRPVAVLAWPWAPEGEALRAVTAASGAILATSAYAVIAVSPERGFVPRLYRSGSVAVFDARLLAACLPARG